MRKSDLVYFDTIVKTADAYNVRVGFKRFYTIRSREGKVLTFGLYDYRTKKYVLARSYQNLENHFKEMEDMIK